VLSPAIQSEIAARLTLAFGLVQTVDIRADSSEYDIRNSMSRLYYAFFHVGLALLLSIGLDVQNISKDHGRLHAALQRRLGKYFGTMVTNLYRTRKFCDYDAAMFKRMHSGNIEKARQEYIPVIKSAKTNFHWMYQEAKKVLK
jgi:uncharacterized protein (UPF0332 family)